MANIPVNVPQYPVFAQAAQALMDDDYYDDDEDDDELGGVVNPMDMFGGFGNVVDDDDPYNINDDDDDDDDDVEDDINQFMTLAGTRPAIGAPPPAGLLANAVPRAGFGRAVPMASVPLARAPVPQGRAPVPVSFARAPVPVPQARAPVPFARAPVTPIARPPTQPRLVVTGGTAQGAGAPGVFTQGTPTPGAPQTVLRIGTPQTVPLPGAAGTPMPGAAPSAPLPVPILTPGQVVRPSTQLNIEQLLAKMPGVYTTLPAGLVVTDINDILKQDVDETAEDFEARRRLTLQLANIPDYPLNPVSAVTIGQMMMKKARLGLAYDQDMEAALSYLTELLRR